jgi:hypothetical protein
MRDVIQNLVEREIKEVSYYISNMTGKAVEGLDELRTYRSRLEDFLQGMDEAMGYTTHTHTQPCPDCGGTEYVCKCEADSLATEAEVWRAMYEADRGDEEYIEYLNHLLNEREDLLTSLRSRISGAVMALKGMADEIEGALRV